MVQERPKRLGRKKVRGRPKKAPATRPRAKAKKPPVLKEEQLPGLLEADIPEQPPIAEKAAVVEERPAVAVAEVAAISPKAVEAVEKAVLATEPKPAQELAEPSTLPITLMTRPQFRRRVIQSVVRRLR